MEKEQLNFRITPEGRSILDRLAAHLSEKNIPERGRKVTQAEVIERAIRLLARRENILKKIPEKA